MDINPEVPSELVVTAYHEAGHAVVAWLHGIKIRWVSIEQTGVLGGHAAFDASVIDPKERTPESAYQIMLAGGLAEIMLTKRDDQGRIPSVDEFFANPDNLNIPLPEVARLDLLAIAEISAAHAIQKIGARQFHKLAIKDKDAAGDIMWELIANEIDSTYKILIDNWPRVQRLADKLLEKRKIDGATAERIIETE